LLPFQENAVRIAAHHLNTRGGVIVGDVVGLGKTITAAAIASIFEEDYGYETLVLCPLNLVSMWEDYIARYRLHGKVISQSVATTQLENLRRYRLVIVDESHNFRNRDGQRY
jgi:superfamily II DNA or RNA helicase